jgi:hypothetical protein
VRTLTRRHRRKTGSGPPANALIAWVGTDPYLRDAVTTASHRREVALPLPCRSRSATAAMAVCFVLACGATVGIIEIVSHGRSGQLTTTPPPVAGQDRPTASGADALPFLPALPADGASPPGGDHTPAPMKPMLLEGGLLPALSPPAQAPPSDTASMPSFPELSVALPGIDDARHLNASDPELASTRAPTGQAGNPHPHDPAGRPDARAAEKGSGKVGRSIPLTEASDAPLPTVPRGRPVPRGSGTPTGLPQDGTAADGADRTGARQASASDQRPTTSVGSTARKGSPSRVGGGSRTSRVGNNRSGGTVGTVH